MSTLPFIIQQGSIDERLRPCNLSDEFKVNNLQVIVSGLVKLSIQKFQSNFKKRFVTLSYF